MFAIIYCKNVSRLQKYFPKSSKVTLKTNTLFNSEAYWGCLFPSNFDFELFFITSLWHSLVFNLLVSNNCSCRLCKVLHRHLKLYIAIEISIQPSKNCVQQARYATVYLVYLVLSRVLVVAFLSLSMEIYLRGSSNVKIYIATFQKKT